MPGKKVKSQKAKVKSAALQHPEERSDKGSIKARMINTQLMRGRVVSAKTPKTVSVLIERTKIHPVYKRGFIQGKRHLAHSEDNLSEGDIVEITKVRPISKRKHWKVTKVLGKDIATIVSEQLKEEAEEVIAEVMPQSEVEEPVAEESNESKKTKVEEEKKTRKK